ncbi:M1 family metallopeptidase [Aliikangiella sp. IMCC44653]
MKAWFSLILLAVCSISPAQAAADWHTQSNYTQIISSHIHLQLKVDFKTQQLVGSVTHELEYLNQDVNELTLDTRDLDIHKVELLINDSWQQTDFDLAKADPVRGAKLSIPLKPNTTQVKVSYNSRPEASGLQWLAPQQTAGKDKPFMFSQSQAIHARSWIPIQDTPAMRLTYSATITTDKSVRAVMSADNSPQRNPEGIYEFKMPQPIPPYLIAIAVGDIHYKKMSEQTAIYSEKAYLNSAAAEFNDTQAMIEATEKLYGPYRWNQYDLLILPPSFPFGGMENPRLSFITPTVIAGDKSLVNLIAHELAHSWSGNLVTNATWRDLWLNEGFTSYVENRIMEAVFGLERAVMEQALGYQDLKSELQQLDTRDQIMHVDVTNRDPDDAFSGVPYVKGQLFLMFLEQRFGREIFDAFVRKYFEDYAFKSIDTKTFVDYLNTHLLKKHPAKVSIHEVKEWIYQPGLPSYSPKPKSDAFKKVQQHIDSWSQNKTSLTDIPTTNWTIHEWLYFINNLNKDISLNKMSELDNQFKLTQSSNSEVAHAWLLLSIKRGYTGIEKRLEDYLMTIGRRKLIVPLYKALNQKPAYKDFAKRVYQAARPGYHPLAQGSIDAIFTN